MLAHRSLASYRGDGRPGAWLVRIATRHCWRRAAANRRRLALTTPLDDVLVATLPGTGDPARDALDAERREGLRTSVAALPDPYREVDHSPVLWRAVTGRHLRRPRPPDGHGQGPGPSRPGASAPDHRARRVMSAPRGSGQMPERPGSDPAVEALLDYLATTAVTPPADLTGRIHARIAQEPDRTPPRRYLLALLHLRLRTAAGAFRQLVGVAGGRGTFPAVLRVQALGLVLVTVLTVAALGAGAAVGISRLVQDRRVTDITPHPTQSVLPGPKTTPTPRASDDLIVQEASPRSSEPSETPSRTPHPSRTPRPQRATGSEPTHAPVAPSQHPTRTPKAGHPEPTRTPHPTSTRTPRPTKTPRPERTQRPEPTETPASGDDGGHGGHDGEGPGETDGPDDHGADGSVWSGDAWMAGLVPPTSPGIAEGPAYWLQPPT